MKSKYLIAGAGGFIGGHLAKNLLEEGHDVVCETKPTGGSLRVKIIHWTLKIT